VAQSTEATGFPFRGRCHRESERRAPGKPVSSSESPSARSTGQSPRGHDPPVADEIRRGVRGQALIPGTTTTLRKCGRRPWLERPGRAIGRRSPRAAPPGRRTRTGRAFKGATDRLAGRVGIGTRDQPDRGSTPPGLTRADPARMRHRGDIDAILGRYRTKDRTPVTARRSSRKQRPASSSRRSRGGRARPPRLRRGRGGRRQRRLRRLLPVQAVLRRLRQGPHHVHRLRRGHHRADVHCTRAASPRRSAERVQPRQARLEGRLAHGAGRTRAHLRALRRRPLLARLVFVVGRPDRARDLRRRPAIGPM